MEQHNIKETKHGPATILKITERDIIRTVNMQSLDFEDTIEASMDNLELVDATFPTDSESEAADDLTPLAKPNSHSTRTATSTSNESTQPRNRTNSSSSTDSSISQSEAEPDGVSGSPSADPFRSQESLSMKHILQPFLMPFQERRRLSQCKEEDEEEWAERVARGNAQKTGVRHKFIVTKAELEPRAEAQHLRNMTAKQNSATIHFPCSSATQQRSTLQELFFSPHKELNPHMDRRYFDTSLVEIRSQNTSTQSLNKCVTDIVDGNVWVPRKNNDLSSSGLDNVSGNGGVEDSVLFSSSSPLKFDISKYAHDNMMV